MNIFDFYLPEEILVAFSLIVLVFVLSRILWKPLMKVIDSRQASVDEMLQRADEAKAIIARMEEQRANHDAEMERQAAEKIKDACDFAARQAEQLVAEGKVQAENIIAAARKQFEAERQAAVAKLKLETAALVIAASSKLMARELSGDDNRRYVNMLLEELAVQKGQS